MAGPLEGIRIVDLSRVLAGPAATRVLADQGADVIKVEPPEGDISRYLGVQKDSISSFYLNINRNKRAIALNLRKPESIEIIKRLIKGADAIVQNFRPGVMEKMGLDETAVRAIQPDIVYVSISGFGEKGPYAHQRVYDPVIQALSGLTDIQADLETGRPRMVRTIIPDKTTALTGAQAITAALLKRARTGEGCHVRLAMLDATIAFLWPEGMVNQTVVDDPDADRVGQLAQDLIYQTADGYITAAAVSNQEWAGMCEALGKPEWEKDPRFATPADRLSNSKIRLTQVSAIIEKQSSAYWLEKLDAASVPSAPVLMRKDVLEDPQVIANELILEYDHPSLGRVRQPRGAARFDEADLAPHYAARLGQHNAEVLKEIGYSDDEVEALQNDKVTVAHG
ncbi:MAG: CoA transferase [Pseudomonadota bacterium]